MNPEGTIGFRVGTLTADTLKATIRRCVATLLLTKTILVPSIGDRWPLISSGT